MNAENTAQRLQETTAKCLNSLEAWNKDLTNEEARETLQEAVHELRKVTSRLEIDIALNDRKNTNAKPIPVPEHKSKMEKKKQKPLSEILPVAELREAGEKRKIAIKEAKEAEDQIDDDAADQAPEDADQDDAQQEPAAKKRRPQRRKRLDHSDD